MELKNTDVSTYPDYIQERIKETFFLVDASSNEEFYLWQRHSAKVKWEEDSCGYGWTIGFLDNRPICISISWAVINKKRVAFYEGTSQLVDHLMIEKWLEKVFPNLTWDNGTRRANTNSSNFNHCLHAIEDANKKSK